MIRRRVLSPAAEGGAPGGAAGASGCGGPRVFSSADDPEWQARMAAFHQGLQELG